MNVSEGVISNFGISSEVVKRTDVVTVSKQNFQLQAIIMGFSKQKIVAFYYTGCPFIRCTQLYEKFKNIFLFLIFVNSQPEAQFFPIYVYFDTLHVSSNHVLIIRRINCINTTSGVCHSVQVTVWYAGMDNCIPDVLYMFRATMCSSSGESIVSIRRLAYVILYR